MAPDVWSRSKVVTIGLIGVAQANDREDLVIEVDEPTAATTGLLPGWTTAMLGTYTGPATITTPGTVISNMIIDQYIDIRAADVEIDNCKVIGTAVAATSGEALITADNAACVNLTVTNTQLDPQAPSLYLNGFQGHDFTARFVDVRNCVDAFSVRDPNTPTALLNVVIEQCLARDPSWFSPDPNHGDNMTHNDLIQIQGGDGTGTSIRGNALWAVYSAVSGSGSKPDRGTGDGTNGRYTIGANTAIQWTNLSGYTTDVDVLGNWIYGGNRGINAGSAASTDIGRILRNWFDDNQGDRVGSSTSRGQGYTVAMDATTTCNTGDGTGNANRYMASVPTVGGDEVTVKRNQ